MNKTLTTRRKTATLGAIGAAGSLIAVGMAVLPSSPATAAPNHSMPFPCGQTWTANTYAGHQGADSNTTTTGDLDLNRPNDVSDTVVASAGGTVWSSGSESGGGNTIRIDHGGGFYSVYAHLETRSVGKGATVAKGQKIGTVGNTGTSSGPHLHYEQQSGLNNSVRAVFDGVGAPVWLENGVVRGTNGASITSKNGCSSANTRFAADARSTLSITSDRQEVRLQVCGSNISGQTLNVRLSRPAVGSVPAAVWNASQRATSNCVTFPNLEGTGGVMNGTTYTTRVAMNQAPSASWPVPCGAATGSQGLCDSVRS